MNDPPKKLDALTALVVKLTIIELYKRLIGDDSVSTEALRNQLGIDNKPTKLH